MCANDTDASVLRLAKELYATMGSVVTWACKRHGLKHATIGRLELVVAMILDLGDGQQELRFVGRLSGCTAQSGIYEATYNFVRYNPPHDFATKVRYKSKYKAAGMVTDRAFSNERRR